MAARAAWRSIGHADMLAPVARPVPVTGVGSDCPDFVLDFEVLDERADDAAELGGIRPGEAIRAAARVDLRAELHLNFLARLAR